MVVNLVTHIAMVTVPGYGLTNMAGPLGLSPHTMVSPFCPKSERHWGVTRTMFIKLNAVLCLDTNCVFDRLRLSVSHRLFCFQRVEATALSCCWLMVPIGSWPALPAYLCPGWLFHPAQRVGGTQGSP